MCGTVLTCGLFSDTTGACFGAVEACFLNPVPGQTTPLIFKAFNIMAKRSVLLGQSLAVFNVLETMFTGHCVESPSDTMQLAYVDML